MVAFDKLPLRHGIRHARSAFTFPELKMLYTCYDFPALVCIVQKNLKKKSPLDNKPISPPWMWTFQFPYLTLTYCVQTASAPSRQVELISCFVVAPSLPSSCRCMWTQSPPLLKPPLTYYIYIYIYIYVYVSKNEQRGSRALKHI